jgi:hypothetical protein
MGLFYEPQVQSTESVRPIVESALKMDSIPDPDLRREVAAQMVAGGAQGNVTTPNPVWWRVVVAFLLSGLLFLGATLLENTTEHAESSKSLLRVFEVAFTAILALFGIETAKQKA